ncbi:hypothetical protein EBU94_02765 [bacterium]|nr:hypothetical protein [bacterium]
MHYNNIDFEIFSSLTAKELKYSKKIYTYLKKRVGKSKSKTCTEILLTTGLFLKVEGVIFRKIIHYLRLNVNPNICAFSKGYYIAETEEELRNFIISLKSRIATQQQTIYHIENGLLNFHK